MAVAEALTNLVFAKISDLKVGNIAHNIPCFEHCACYSTTNATPKSLAV
jgi:hypothetical protein